MKSRIIIGIIALSGLMACEKEIDISLPPAPKDLVAEAYINNYNPLLNYVILSRTVDYFNPDLSLPTVSGAEVDITEGTLNGQDTVWGTPVRMLEIAPDTLPGIYLNPALNGQEGKVYKLEIRAEGQYLFAVTRIPQVVPLDSVAWSVKTEPDTFALLTAYFTDPAPRGNNYRVMYKIQGSAIVGGWGNINDGDVVRDDELINNQVWDFRYTRQFYPGDTLQFFLNSIDRPVYQFWDSYFSLRGNTGNPFATPIQLRSNIQGGIGCFSGMGVSYRQLIVPGP